MPADEQRLRNWLWDKTLSGDILLEQNVHVVDVCNWIMGAHPVKAVARASRKVIPNCGDINDNYEVIFTYADEVDPVFSSTQFNQNGYFDVAEQIFGSEGLAEAPYKGAAAHCGKELVDVDRQSLSIGEQIRGGRCLQRQPGGCRRQERSQLHREDHQRQSSKPDKPGVESARSCMLARKSAETGRPVTWEEIEHDCEAYKLDIDLKRFT